MLGFLGSFVLGVSISLVPVWMVCETSGCKSDCDLSFTGGGFRGNKLWKSEGLASTMAPPLEMTRVALLKEDR